MEENSREYNWLNCWIKLKAHLKLLG